MKSEPETLPVILRDPWLKESEAEIVSRYRRYREKLSEIERTSGSITDYANGYRYFGFQRDDLLEGWWFREWLPG
ncbi:MAG: 1,4-alpha-glucan-branching enzyme, partial [Rikenellaceae bacterium]|nr:1,4-alpha-glucan-branching enzyme [Rikenellaceae bacterium]